MVKRFLNVLPIPLSAISFCPLLDAQDDTVAPAAEAKPAAATVAKKPAARKPPVKKAAAPIAKVKEEVKALASEVEKVAKDVKEKGETTLS